MPPKRCQSLLSSFRCAGRGVWDGMQQRNARIHLTCAVAVIALAVWLQPPAAGWISLILCIAGVFTAELLNSAIESVVDLASPEHHELARRAKDIAAGAVLLASLGAAIVGGIVLLPPLWELWNG